jgi:transposase
MIQVSPQTPVLVHREAVDFRKGMDGLVGLCREELELDPFSGTIFVFRNSKSTAIKLLFYDGQGFWLCQKRFSEGKIHHWPLTAEDGSRAIHLAGRELYTLLWNGDPEGACFAPEWKKIA